MLSRAPHRQDRTRRRGGVLLEFVLILPLFLYLTLMSFDVGRLMVTYGALTDSAYVAARSAAQVGADTKAMAEGVAGPAFDQAISGVPGISGAAVKVVDTGFCSSASGKERPYIEVQATSTVRLMSPGMGRLASALSSEDAAKQSNGLQMASTAQVLCEVTS